MAASLIKANRIDGVANSGMGNFAMFLLAAFTQSLFAMESAKTESAPVPAIDDEGSLIQLAAPANRIISLAPSLTELIYAAGAGDKLGHHRTDQSQPGTDAQASEEVRQGARNT